MIPDARIPRGDVGDKWGNCLDELHLVSPVNKSRYKLNIRLNRALIFGI